VPTSARLRFGRGVPDSVGELRDEIVEQPLAFGVERRHRLLEDVRRRHNLRGGVGQLDAADPRLDLVLAAPRTSAPLRGKGRAEGGKRNGSLCVEIYTLARPAHTVGPVLQSLLV
jgi:hypothetical protein